MSSIVSGLRSGSDKVSAGGSAKPPIAGARTGSVSSKKNDTGTSSTRLSSCSRLAPIRFAPRSYFCTCWKVSPIASPSFSWLRPSMLRRSRSRAPTRMSIGLGVSILGRPGRRGGCDRAIFENQQKPLQMCHSVAICVPFISFQQVSIENPRLVRLTCKFHRHDPNRRNTAALCSAKELRHLADEHAVRFLDRHYDLLQVDPQQFSTKFR